MPALRLRFWLAEQGELFVTFEHGEDVNGVWLDPVDDAVGVQEYLSHVITPQFRNDSAREGSFGGLARPSPQAVDPCSGDGPAVPGDVFADVE